MTPPILDISVFVCKVISSSPFENSRLHTHTDVVSSYKLSCFCCIRRYISCAPFALQWLYKVLIVWRCFDPLIPVQKENYINKKKHSNSVVVLDLKFQVWFCLFLGKVTAAHLPNTWRQWWSKTGAVQWLCFTKQFCSHQSMKKWINPPFIYDVPIKMFSNTMYLGLNKTIYSKFKGTGVSVPCYPFSISCSSDVYPHWSSLIRLLIN